MTDSPAYNAGQLMAADRQSASVSTYPGKETNFRSLAKESSDKA